MQIILEPHELQILFSNVKVEVIVREQGAMAPSLVADFGLHTNEQTIITEDIEREGA